MHTSLEQVIEQAGRIILGKRHTLRMALACLIARGHLLIEDRPGVGKTTLAHALARLLGLDYSRIQFTSDLLPADILGVSVYGRDDGRFEFHPGPVFAQLVLADEINRATPKAQSALLEAMEERQVTVEGQTRRLPSPFFVIATQNPTEQVGTYPLPESQLDRFLMRLEVGYPDHTAERALLRGEERRDLIDGLIPCLDAESLQAIQRRVPEIHASDALLDYLQALLSESRASRAVRAGLSPRAGIALLRAAQAWALLEGRNHVLPEDLQTVLPAVAGHRLHAADETRTVTGATLVRDLVEAVPLP